LNEGIFHNVIIKLNEENLYRTALKLDISTIIAYSVMISQRSKNLESGGNRISAARIHKYDSPLKIDEIQKPVISSPEQVIVKVGATGLCHSDLHLIHGDWQKTLPLNLPKTPGHEIAGWVEEIGNEVPTNSIKRGDLVAVFGGWGCGYCSYCKSGDEQMCKFAKWPGLSEHDGGFSEYILVPSHRFLVKADNTNTMLNPQDLAPLTDAGLTPYRAIKKIRHVLSADKNIAIIGVGGLGFYAIQYAQILGSGANVTAMDRSDKKLALSEDIGADYTVNIQNSNDFKEFVHPITQGHGFDVILDTVGLESTLKLAVSSLNKNGALVVVGLFGKQITMPLFQTVIQEYQVYGSLWGNYNELCEVIDLAKKGKIKHRLHKFSLSDINNAIELLRKGEIDGRAVIVP
jgi:propanol-preferring alcohol dehydrogenase